MITITTILFFLLGFICNILVQIIEAKKNKEFMSIAIWASKNWLAATLGLILGFVAMYFGDALTNGLGVEINLENSKFPEAHAFISGLTPFAVIKNIFKIDINDNN